MSEQKVTPKDKTVTFLLPGPGNHPIGGFKIVYEFANGLADRGWRVRIVHGNCFNYEGLDAACDWFIRRIFGVRSQPITVDYRPDVWFKVNPNVELLWAEVPHPGYMPASDVWVATWWYTAKWVANYIGARVYLIQSVETWGGPEADVMATWKLPLRKVVTSRWLEDVARGLGERAEYIPTGLNFDTFGMDVAPEGRSPNTVAMLYHVAEVKRSADGLAALCKVKASVPSLRAHIFGVYPRPSDMPSWMEYYQEPPQRVLREIYNKVAIFISPSRMEGWPLPPAEAMQCGAALAATDIGGHREYAHHEETALLSPPKDPDALAANILRLVEDRELRLRLAHKGHEQIQQHTWDRAVTRFDSVLEATLAEPLPLEHRWASLHTALAVDPHALRRLARSVFRVGFWQPILGLTRPVRHAIGLRQKTVQPTSK
jgi:glycosyltransferase involved in cell wall biosynthesis